MEEPKQRSQTQGCLPLCATAKCVHQAMEGGGGVAPFFANSVRGGGPSLQFLPSFPLVSRSYHLGVSL